MYLEQSALDQIVQDRADWRNSPWSKLLLEAQASGRAEVWASPANVIELALLSDTGFRQLLSGALFELIDKERVLHSSEFLIVRDLLDAIASAWPKGVKCPELVQQWADECSGRFLGFLGQLAASPTVTLPLAFADVQRSKLTTRLILAEAAADLSAWLDRWLAVGREGQTTQGNPHAAYDALTLDDISRRLGSTLARVQQLDGKEAQKIQKNRDEVTRTYAINETVGAVEAVFLMPGNPNDPSRFDAVFDLDAIHGNWGQLPAITGRSAPPPPEKMYGPVLSGIIHQLRERCPLLATLQIDVVLRDLEASLRRKKGPKEDLVPTEGLVLDIEHAAALSQCDLVAVHDGKLAKALAQWAKRLKDSTGHEVRIVRTIKDLRRELG